ncbi:hypothetical protein N9O47_02485 [Candidatus Pelagibacter sp.]|nr:hypothetical protein [Candidatus Pelagibacter sp.]
MEHVTIVSHDAGGAEILSSWLRRNNCLASVVAFGPAENIFKRKCPKADFTSLDKALTKSNWLLCGTGWQTSFERHAIIQGRDLGMKTVAFLDHWVNYRERFDENGRIVLPDEIWVGDSDAERIAHSLFDKTPILLKPNPYLQDLLDEMSGIKKIKSEAKEHKVLYVCEPIEEHALLQYGNKHHLGYTEFDALSFFLNNLSALGKSIDCITIRPHPSEREDKYQWAISQFQLPLKFGGKKTLIEETLECDIVVGCESMAMVVGLMAEKRVISSIPPGGRPCQLPQQDIEHLQKLIKSRGFDHD